MQATPPVTRAALATSLFVLFSAAFGSAQAQPGQSPTPVAPRATPQQYSYTVIDLSALGTARRASPSGFGPDGRVLGTEALTTSEETYRAYVTGPDATGVFRLGTLGGDETYPTAMNARGRIVGCASTPALYLAAFMTAADGHTLIDIGGLGGNETCTTGINADGRIVGYADTPDFMTHGFVTDRDGANLRDVGDLGGGEANVNGINDAGAIVGWATVPAGPNHAFIADARPDGRPMQDLGTFGGRFSTANAINAAGRVVGSASLPNGHSHAFITGPDARGKVDLDASRPVGDSTLVSINSSGRAVGSQGLHRFRAVVTNVDGTGLLLLDNLAPIPHKVGLETAVAIDDEGRILVRGSDRRVYLLIPN